MYKVVISFLTIFIILPLVSLFCISFTGESSFTIINLKELLLNQEIQISFKNSFLLSFFSSIIALFICFFISYFLHFTKSNCKFFIYNMMTVTMLIPSIAFGFIIMYLFGKVGIITRLVGFEIVDIYSFQAMIIAYVLYIIGPMFIVVNNSFNKISKNEINISEVFSDSKFRKFINCVYYKIRGGLISAFFIGFTLIFTDYGIALSLGYNTASTQLYELFLGSSPDIIRGCVLALLICIPSIITYGILLILNPKKDYDNYDVIKVIESKSLYRDIFLKTTTYLTISGIAVVLLILIFMPFLGNYPNDFSLNFENINIVVNKYNIVSTTCVTLMIAFFTSLVGTLLTYCTAYYTSKYNNKLAFIVDKVSLIPNLIPGMTVGISFMIFFKASFIYNTLFIIIIANVVHFYSTPYLIFKEAFLNIPCEYTHVSNVFGDSNYQYFKNVIFKQTIVEIINVFTFFITSSITTISAIAFLTTASNMTLSLKIKELEHYADYGSIFVITLLILIINLVIKYSSNIIVSRNQV